MVNMHSSKKPSANLNNNSAKTTEVNLPPDAIAARNARLAAEARGFFWVKEFAAAIGRAPQYVSDRCNARAIRTMLGGKPYRIPFTELDVWMNKKVEKPKPAYYYR